jgi:hypothetical protein
MNEKANEVDVRIHFPNTSVTLDRVPRWRADAIRTMVRKGEVFETESGGITYQINPGMVTYVEIRDWLPF